eukprot:TRINITY_DN29875_c0_g2_i1.p1 TRINITY_DN29875_c0_g2~~TRINITY_DN29875_c0_g2_i1.p1  ORF type:complete len:801 (-),score=234.42 TRINITY_DN29875_c0_g2_i1:218-2620(-)
MVEEARGEARGHHGACQDLERASSLCSSRSDACSSFEASRLKELLLSEHREADRLKMELRARDWERWQLLQLLQEKDAELAREPAVSSTARCPAAGSRAAAETQQERRAAVHWAERAECAAARWLAVGVFRAWREIGRHRGAARLVEHSKQRLAATRLSHSCHVLASRITGAQRRRCADFFRSLAVHAACARMAGGSMGAAVDRDRGRPMELSLTSGPAGAHDQASVAATPRIASPLLSHRSVSSMPWQLISPCLKGVRSLGGSLPSDASTCAPSSTVHSSIAASASWATAAPLLPPALPLLRLSWTLEGLMRRRKQQALRRWAFGAMLSGTYDGHSRGSRSPTARLSPSRGRHGHTEASSPMQAAQPQGSAVPELPQQDDRLVAELRSVCCELESRSAALVESRDKLHCEYELVACSEKALAARCGQLTEEVEAARRRREEPWRNGVGRADASTDTAGMEVATTRDEARIRQLEGDLRRASEVQGKLEAKLTRSKDWRGRAEAQIKDMVACGEQLEQEKAELARELLAGRKQQLSLGEQLKAFASELGAEEQLGAMLEVRERSLREETATLSRSLHEERSRYAEASCQLQRRLLDAQSDCREAGEELSKLSAQKAAAEGLRSDLSTFFDEERRRLTAARDELAKNLADARVELVHAQKAEAAQPAALRRAFQEGEEQARRASREAARQAVASEEALCGEMADQLRGRLAELQASSCASPPRRVPPLLLENTCSSASTIPPSTGPATPRLRELDAYAELVDKLRLELSREREEREAAVRSLDSLRSSYRLLLQRVAREER